MTKRWYGVSKGNGNDGVSHMYPDYYVYTDEPWLLAHAAIIDDYLSDKDWLPLAIEAEVDGDVDYTISAVIYEGPEGETEFGSAVAIVDVFPVDEGDVEEPGYHSLGEALSLKAIELARKG